MHFTLIKHDEIFETSYPPLVPEPVEHAKIVRTYDVAGVDRVFTQVVGYTQRRRRFLIDRLEITWTRAGGEPYQRRFITATGPTVMANGEVSPRSTGYQFWWPHEDMPDDITELARQEDQRYAIDAAIA